MLSSFTAIIGMVLALSLLMVIVASTFSCNRHCLLSYKPLPLSLPLMLLWYTAPLHLLQSSIVLPLLAFSCLWLLLPTSRLAQLICYVAASLLQPSLLLRDLFTVIATQFPYSSPFYFLIITSCVIGGFWCSLAWAWWLRCRNDGR